MKSLIYNKKHSIMYGGNTIIFSLFYSDRKTMEVSVHPDCTVVVKVPLLTDITLIEKKVFMRSRWILKQLNYFKQFSPKTPERCYLNGETHLYLGKQYRLKVSVGTENSVKLSHGFFYITCRSMLTPGAVKKLLDHWYLEKARLQFFQSMNRSWQKFNGLGIEQPKLSMKRMKTRWGSLSDKGTVTLNTDLIRAPKECIDYVVTHELCHLKYHNHSPEFYALLDSIIPGWKMVKHRLEVTLS